MSESCEVILNEGQAEREGQRGQQSPMDSITSSSSLDYQPEATRPSRKPQSLGLEALEFSYIWPTEARGVACVLDLFLGIHT